MNENVFLVDYWQFVEVQQLVHLGGFPFLTVEGWTNYFLATIAILDSLGLMHCLSFCFEIFTQHALEE